MNALNADSWVGDTRQLGLPGYLFLCCIVLKTNFKHWNYFVWNGMAVFQPARIPYVVNLARGLSRRLSWLWKGTSGGWAIAEPLYIRRMDFKLYGWVCRQKQSTACKLHIDCSYKMFAFMDQRLPPEHLVCGHVEVVEQCFYTVDKMKIQFLAGSLYPLSVHWFHSWKWKLFAVLWGMSVLTGHFSSFAWSFLATQELM